MVKEMRKIILSRDELISALESYKHANVEFLPVGKIVKCELKTGMPVTVGVENTFADTAKTTEAVFEPSSLLEPLIRFCIESNIILPRNSRKSAVVGDDQAALFIQMGGGADGA